MADPKPQNEETQKDGEGFQETFISHLFELRDRVVKAAIAVIVVFVSLVYWAPDIFHLFAKPMLDALPAGGKMIVTDVTGSFFVPMKVTMVVALLVSLPWVLYQAWAFIAPGLYLHEKRLIAPLIMIVLEKKREVAILKAMGAKDSGILTIFLVQGVVIGVMRRYEG